MTVDEIARQNDCTIIDKDWRRSVPSESPDQFPINYELLAPLAEDQRAIVMALCPSCLRPSVRPSLNFSF